MDQYLQSTLHCLTFPFAFVSSYFLLFVNDTTVWGTRPVTRGVHGVVTPQGHVAADKSNMYSPVLL